MSKITGKKRSCFEITSVTPAQKSEPEAGGIVVGDGSERLDDPQEPRTDPRSPGGCDRISPDDTWNNVGENQEGQLPFTSPFIGGISMKSTSSGRNTPHNVGGSVPFVPSSHIVTSATAVITSMSHTAPSNSCSSRFRVIKLDHSNGEPFRRGRWTCTEFYVKESDSGVHRTVDSLKSSPSIDHSVDRDSGLGATCNSIVGSSAFPAQALENSIDSGYSVSAGYHTHSQAPESLQQGYSLSPHIGSGASAFQPTGYAATAAASQQSKQAQVTMSPGTPQTFIPDSLNGVHHSAIIPPASLPQQFAYSPLPSQQHFGSSTQNLPITSSSIGSTSQVSSPQFTLAGPGAQGPSGDVSFMHQVANASVVAPVISGSTQQQPSGGAGSAPAPSATAVSIHSGGQNVPATVPSTTSVPPGVSSQAPGVAGLIQLQGAYGRVVNPAEDGWKMTEALPQQSVGVGAVKDHVQSPIGEGLSLTSPGVNSFFGIQITMNEDGDGASGANVVAIDNKIEQAMDLVKSHLMYAVREEVEVLKEQIKELYERNSVLERENAVLKSLANTHQLSQLSNQLSCLSSPQLQLHQPPFIKNSTHSLVHHEGSQGVSYQPNITSA
ncbi:TSC22 domain family protein 2 [Poecilia latipinna]|uniref:TSC22 domain family 2 n=1 Tax=Poecilia latipinna TaxID=48699 RepID=A0A3B3UTT0_9TELE|nr:PREDICTED: TSC22 domain family protein 2-like [Poecilia latipinna]